MRRKFKKEAGFTLIELMMALLIIGVTTKIVAVSFEDIGYTARYEQTVERLNSIKEAILGNPRQVINGQQAVSGFVADMGRLPVNLRELIDQNYCAVDRTIDETTSPTAAADCNALAAGAWKAQPNWQLDALSGLMLGWRGPYLSVSGSVTKTDAITDGWGREAQGYCSDPTITSSALCTLAALWTLSVADQNYGWYYDAVTYAPDLTFFSYGKDQVSGGLDYDADYPVVRPVFGSDWLLDVSNGISVNFIKLNSALPISLCTDTTKITKATCLPPETWYGGCDKAKYFNKTSCTTAAGTWVTCSEGISATKPLCELAGKNWYGEGFGCSDQSKSNKALCSSPDVWRSCTDDGTIATINACSAANEIWYGDGLFSIATIPIQPIPPTVPICMKVFYRKPDSSIGVLVSDENKATVINDPKLITADGSFQTIRFTDLRDSSSNLLVTEIPIGSNAIGVYQYDGISCNTSNLLYPINHKTPIQVDFHPHTTLPVINW